MEQLHLCAIVAKIKTMNAMRIALFYYLMMAIGLNIPQKIKKNIKMKLEVAVYVARFAVVPPLMMLVGYKLK